MSLSLSTVDTQLHISTGKQPEQTAHIPLSEQLKKQLLEICTQYQRLRDSNSNEALMAVGSDLFGLINVNTVAINDWLNSTGSRTLTLYADVTPSNDQALLLNLPWELLANNGRFVCDDDRPFEVIRRIGKAATPKAPQNPNLTLAFMAADPGFDSKLNYEAEEKAILQAFGGPKAIELVVDDSGNLKRLSERLNAMGYCEVMHLSCHGGYLDSEQKQDFALMLEDDRFGVKPARVEDFIALSNKIDTLFLSACHSAEINSQPSMAMRLTATGFNHVVGWDGPVADHAATAFAAEFYHLIQNQHTVPFACAYARKKLLKQNLPHWHLGRCYIGPHGGGALIDGQKAPRKSRKGKSCYDLLDKAKREVKVASKATFVGRRRQTKQAIQHFEQNNKAGVVLYGVGGTGKSSLAARILDRLEPGYKAVVIYKHYQASDILMALQGAYKGPDATTLFATLISQAAQRPQDFEFILSNLLENQFDATPIVLVVDDIEQHILQPLDKEQTAAQVKPEYQGVLSAIINAFDGADSQSYLLLTSRYRFALPDNFGNNLADKLAFIDVPDMTKTEQLRHWLALLQTSDNPAQRDSEKDQTYLAQILTHSKGNPGLQAILYSPLLGQEYAVLEQTLSKIAQLTTGDSRTTRPTDDLDKYLQRLALETYANALSYTETELLRILSMFDFALPRALFEQAGAQLGIDDIEKALTRLDNFGLMIHWQGEGLDNHISCYQIAQNVVEPLTIDDRNAIAQILSPILWQLWFSDAIEVNQLPQAEDIEQLINVFEDRTQRAEKAAIVGKNEKDIIFTPLEYSRLPYFYQCHFTHAVIDRTQLDIPAFVMVNILELLLGTSFYAKLWISLTVLSKQKEDLNKAIIVKVLNTVEEHKTIAQKEQASIIKEILSRCAYRPELLHQAFKHYFATLEPSTIELLAKVDLTETHAKYLTTIELAKEQSAQEHAKACGDYALFLENQKQDYDAAEAYYLKAIELAPNDSDFIGNYANFLADQKQDYDAAETYYLRAIEANPNHVNSLGSYANFLADQKQDYDTAKTYYLKALKADPNNAITLSNYANLLADQKQDYDAAEAYYLKALKADPNDANILANYAKLLFILDQQNKAIAMLDQAQSQQGLRLDLQVECAFYRFAHCPPFNLAPLKTLVLKGARSMGWVLDNNVQKARLEGHPEPELLQQLAEVISKNADIAKLEAFELWLKSECD